MREIIVIGRLHWKHPLLWWGEGRTVLQFLNSQQWILPSCVAFHNVSALGKGRGGGCRERDKLERSHFFSITIARLQGHYSQWAVHGDTPPRNTLIMDCWRVSKRELAMGGWEVGARLSTSQSQKREYPSCGGRRERHKVITIIKSNCHQAGVGLCSSQTGNSFCADTRADPLAQKFRRKKAGDNLFLLNHQHLAG